MTERPRGMQYRAPLLALIALALEYLFLTLGFDGKNLVAREAAWGWLQKAHLAGPALIGFGAALWILGREEARDALERAARPGQTRLWVRVGIHLMCFVSLAVLTALTFSDEPPSFGPAWLWVALWIGAASTTLLSLVAVATSGFSLRSLLTNLARPIAIASLWTVLALFAGLATVRLWDDLGILTLQGVYISLNAIGASVLYDPAASVVGTPDFTVEITSDCSGYEGIGLVVAFLGAYIIGFRDRFRFPHVLVLLPIAVAAAWALNVVRIFALILIGSAGFVSLAAGGFHSKAGWLFSCGVALGCVAVSQHLNWFSSSPDQRKGRSYNPSGPYLLPLLAVLAASLFSGLFESDFEYLYPVRVAVGLLVLSAYLGLYRKGAQLRLHGRALLSMNAVGVGVLVYVVWTLMSELAGIHVSDGPPQPLVEMSTLASALWIGGRLLGGIVVVPVVEELAFRGFLLRRIVSADFTSVPYDQWHWGAALISSLVFAVAHQQMVPGFIAGMLYAYAQWKRGLLSDAVIAHAVTNALIAVEVLGRGSWDLW